MSNDLMIRTPGPTLSDFEEVEFAGSCAGNQTALLRTEDRYPGVLQTPEQLRTTTRLLNTVMAGRPGLSREMFYRRLPLGTLDPLDRLYGHLVGCQCGADVEPCPPKVIIRHAMRAFAPPMYGILPFRWGACVQAAAGLSFPVPDVDLGLLSRDDLLGRVATIDRSGPAHSIIGIDTSGTGFWLEGISTMVGIADLRLQNL